MAAAAGAALANDASAPGPLAALVARALVELEIGAQRPAAARACLLALALNLPLEQSEQAFGTDTSLSRDPAAGLERVPGADLLKARMVWGVWYLRLRVRVCVCGGGRCGEDEDSH